MKDPVAIDGWRDPEVERGAAEPSTDELLVRRAQQGEVGAFEGLYRSNVGRVYAVCLRISRDAALAEELTQEAFVRAWQKLSSFRGDSAFSTWLHRLAVNVALGHRRRRLRREAPAPEEPPVVTESANASGPDAGLDLERAIAALPDRARTVFVLHDVEGYRHDEIADLAGMAVGTSKAHLFRARRLLREALA